MNPRRITAVFRLHMARIRHLYQVDVLARAHGEFSRKHGSVYAAAVTYYVIFSLFPLLIFMVAVFGLIFHNPDMQARVVDYIMQQIPHALKFRAELQSILSGAASAPNGLLGLVGLAGLAWTASGMFGALRRALNNAFDIESARSYVRGRTLDILGVIAVLILFMLSVVLTTAMEVFRAQSDQLFDSVLINLAWVVVYLLLPLAISWCVFFATYRWIPNHSLNRSDLWMGSLVAAIGFELAKTGLGIYLVNFAHYSDLYGTLGGLVAFLFFVFLESNIVIFGAELASELAKDHRKSKSARA